MLEIALVAISSILALVGAGFAARFAHDGVLAETARSTRHLRDDAIVGAIASLVVFVATALGRTQGAMVLAAWSGGACATGVLAAMGARAWRDRVATSSRAAAVVGEQVVIVVALGVLAGIAAGAARVYADPQRLAPQLPEMVVAFAVGCAVLDLGARALPSAAAMVLASYFFDSNAGMLRSAPSYASALGVVLFPLAATALGALGAAVAVSTTRESPRRAQIASVLALPAAAGAALAMLGWMWQPFALCAAIGATMTLVPKLARQGESTRASEAVTLLAIAAGAIGSYAVARHSGLAHAGPFGLGVAAVAAECAALVDRSDAGSAAGGTARTPDAEGDGALADRQAAALAAIAVSLAVLDGATLVRCTKMAEAARAPTEDTAVMLAHCTFANVAPARIDLSQPVVIVAALAGLTLAVLLRAEATLRSRAFVTIVTVGGVAIAGALAHFGFGLGLEAIAAATLASSLAAALFPSACSRDVAALIAASSLALGAVAG